MSASTPTVSAHCLPISWTTARPLVNHCTAVKDRTGFALLAGAAFARVSPTIVIPGTSC